jgi:uncharacterized protein with ATP-grasp and redox domains
MGDLSIVIKAIGEFIVPVLGLALGLCALSKSLARIARITEDAVKKSTVLRVSIGLLLVVFSVVYLAAVIHLQLAQVRQQNPLRQARQSAAALAQELVDLVQESRDENALMMTYRDAYSPRVDKVQFQLGELGIRSPKLEKARTQMFSADVVRTIAAELKRLAEDANP